MRKMSKRINGMILSKTMGDSTRSGMKEEYVFIVTRNADKGMLLEGSISRIDFTSAHNEICTATFTIDVVDSRIVDGEGSTTILKIPSPKSDHPGYIRIRGLKKVVMEHQQFIGTVHVKSFHQTYEDAAAAEMQEKMERRK